MQDVSVQVEGEKVILRAPYNPRIAPFIQGMNGGWDVNRGLFVFPVAMAPHVTALAEAFFLSSGVSELGTFTLDASLYADHQSIEVAGRVLVERVTVSRRPKLGPGVVKVRGDWSLGAGYDFNRTLGANDAVLQVVLPSRISTHNVPGLNLTQTIGRHEALRSEHAALTARLAVINSESEAS